MNPSTVEIKVDLNKKYEWKYDFSGAIDLESQYELIYSIDKAEKDMILQFKYKENIYIPYYYIGDIHANNPLKICPGGGFCSVGRTYKICKGESYKIYITTQHVSVPYKYVHYLPSFSIQFIEPTKHTQEDSTSIKHFVIAIKAFVQNKLKAEMTKFGSSVT